MAYDDVIDIVGGFGLYQKRILLLMCLPIIFVGFYLEPEHKYIWNEHWCLYFAAGVFLGVLLFGVMSDKLGRRPTYLIALASLFTLSVADYFVPGLLRIEMTHLIVGLLGTGVFLVSFVLAIEIVDRDHRKYAGIIAILFYAACAFRFSLKQFKDRYQWVHFVLIGFGLLFLSYYWLIPESGRWLQVKGRKQSAVETSLKAARGNHVEITTQALYTLLDLKVVQEFKTSTSAWDRLRSPNLLITTLLAILVWFGNSLIARYTVYRLGHNPDIVTFFLAVGPISSYVALMLKTKRLSHRPILGGNMILGALCRLFIYVNMSFWIESVFGIVIYIAFTIAFVTLHVLVAEHLPTVVRTLGLGLFFAVGGSGIFLPINLIKGPILLTILIVFGLLSMLLPESVGKPLPDTIEDAKNSARSLETSPNVKLEVVTSAP